LRLSEREFWGLTLAQFASLAKEYKSEQKMLSHRVALVCSVIANAPYKKRNFKPNDFMPKEKKPKMATAQMVDQVKALNIALGGDTK